MSLAHRNYDSYFNPEELQRIAFLRNLDKNRTFIAWGLGLVTAIALFLIQIPFRGNALLHALCSYGSVPAGIGVGVWLYIFVDGYTDREFMSRWDSLFYQRSGTTPEILDAQSEALRLSEDMHFIALPLEQQRRIVNKVYRERGLPEPNALAGATVSPDPKHLQQS